VHLAWDLVAAGGALMRISGVALGSRDTVAPAGTSGLQRVDRVHLAPGGDGRGDPPATVGPYTDLHRGGGKPVRAEINL
jgi:hypothetical protein